MDFQDKRGLSQISGRLSMPKLEPNRVGIAVKNTPKSSPLVSIVTVCFNAIQTLENAINSVKQQTYENIEYIVIDGGSTDGTINIINENEGVVDVVVVEKDNGIYDAMNKGIRKAGGKYIVLLNADDLLYPDFIKASVDTLERTNSDISYCDYETQAGIVSVGELNEGIFISQLGIKHNTFLIKRSCFEQIGLFDESLKVVADSKWNKAAYASGFKFEKTAGAHVFYSTEGVSSAQSQSTKDRIISESASVILDSFLELDENQARDLYLSNFNSIHSNKLVKLFKQFQETSPVLAASIRETVVWNLANRDSFTLDENNPNRVLELIELISGFDLSFDLLRRSPDNAQKDNPILKALMQVQRIKTTGKEVCLHFARVFSRSSETFIYDFLNELKDTDSDSIHVILCDELHNLEIRPYPNVIHIPWESLSPPIRNVLYDVIWELLVPQKIVAHFTLNGWVLHRRLNDEMRQRPWVNMCHGIDVFAIGDNDGYTNFVRQYCALSTNVIFTAVSEYLSNVLESQGVPREKIFLVSNAVSSKFWESRKEDDFWDGTRTLKIVTVGRLIDWKGHDLLLSALSRLKEELPDLRLNLEIIYGRSGELLPQLEKQVENLGLSGQVNFNEFVDFSQNPDYLSRFDLCIQPSTETRDAKPKTETFGVAILEAITAGLPVIGTDAGGIPEVIGKHGAQAAVIPHGDAIAITQAMRKMIENREAVFCDNSTYARSRLNAFSPQSRMDSWSKTEHWFEIQRPKIVHFCSLGAGGAAGAAKNIHLGLLRLGFDSWFFTRRSEKERIDSSFPNVKYLDPDLSVDFQHSTTPRRHGFTIFSVDDYAISNELLRQYTANADIINLAWTANFLSVENISMMSNLGVPLLVTLRDMNHITGGCHFFHGCENWKRDCFNCPQLDINSDQLSHRVFEAKKSSWNMDSINFVALSEHSLKILNQSPISKEARKFILNNYVDTSTFYVDSKPLDELALEAHEGAILLGYLPSFHSRIKGHRELIAALKLVKAKHPETRLTLLVASDQKVDTRLIPFNVIQIPSISDNAKLRKFYNSADLIAVPSTEETFSNTTIEALACGTPVVGFKTGILEELLDGELFGRAVDLFDTEALAEAIHEIGHLDVDREDIAFEIAKKFNWHDCSSRYANVIAELLKSPAISKRNTSLEAHNDLEQLRTYQQRRKTVSIRSRLVQYRNQRLNSEKQLHARTNSNSHAAIMYATDVRPVRMRIFHRLLRKLRSIKDAPSIHQIETTTTQSDEKTPPTPVQIITEVSNISVSNHVKTGEQESVICTLPALHYNETSYPEIEIKIKRADHEYHIRYEVCESGSVITSSTHVKTLMIPSKEFSSKVTHQPNDDDELVATRLVNLLSVIGLANYTGPREFDFMKLLKTKIETLL